MPKQQLFAPFSESQGPFNVPKEQMDRDDRAQKPWRFHTVSNPPPLDWDGEVIKARDELGKHIQKWLNARPPVAIGRGVAVGEPHWDRTYEIAVESPDIFGVEFVEMLQQWLICNYPLWRLVVNDDDIRDCITIYPEAIRIRGESSPDEIAAEIQRVGAAQSRRMREKAARREAQVAEILEGLQAAMPLNDRQAYVVGVSPSTYADPDEIISWVAHHGYRAIDFREESDQWLGYRAALYFDGHTLQELSDSVYESDQDLKGIWVDELVVVKHLSDRLLFVDWSETGVSQQLGTLREFCRKFGKEHLLE